MHSVNNFARRLFSPLLTPLEGGDQAYTYTPRARLILWVVGLLFLGLGTALAVFIPRGIDVAVYVPIGVFCLVGFFAIVVAWLGTERAVAKVWGNRR
ncbi:hypothetical protein [Halopseudomonas sp.]|jgi:hypothetical protein|uniref:hypothetical protein n=1 Tax=Halopseudomonas sp. TaxID=2901191 RepID=UPI0039E214B9